jgi:hypothetical protein
MGIVFGIGNYIGMNILNRLTYESAKTKAQKKASSLFFREKKNKMVSKAEPFFSMLPKPAVRIGCRK